MIRGEKVLYCSALRMKEGELNGLRELASDVACHVIPRIIVPPLGERDEKQFGLFAPGKAPDIGGILAKYWGGRRVFIDLSYLLDEAGRAEAGAWLPDIFKRARSVNLRAIPLAKLSDIGELEVQAFKASVATGEDLKFAICVASGDMVRADFGLDVKSALIKIGLEAHECAVIADFSDADFSDPEPVAPIISGALEQLQALGKWQHIIFQGTYYPESNPADPGESVLCPRNEWLAWCQAVNFDPSTAEHLIFGDYAADSSKMVFGGKGGRPIPHYRYTTPASWLIVRGEANGSSHAVMQDVCNRIVQSGHFAGARFSTADRLIYRTANGHEGPGNAATWRQVNTTHHITRVVTDVALVRGISIEKIPEEAPAQIQMALLKLQ
jgi:hypothetical protein